MISISRNKIYLFHSQFLCSVDFKTESARACSEIPLSVLSDPFVLSSQLTFVGGDLTHSL